jgi:RNA polymerase sigma factor (sigma-70 family)
LTIIYEKYKQAKLEKGILPWAYKVLENVMKDDYRTETRRLNILTEHTDELINIYGSEESIADRASYQELVDEIKMALRQMSESEKAIFNLKLNGYSGVEIQKKLNLKRCTLDVKVFRGIKKLKKLLEKRGVI